MPAYAHSNNNKIGTLSVVTRSPELLDASHFTPVAHGSRSERYDRATPHYLQVGADTHSAPCIQAHDKGRRLEEQCEDLQAELQRVREGAVARDSEAQREVGSPWRTQLKAVGWLIVRTLRCCMSQEQQGLGLGGTCCCGHMG